MFSKSEFDLIITINEPDIQDIFIKMTVSKFDDSVDVCLCYQAYRQKVL